MRLCKQSRKESKIKTKVGIALASVAQLVVHCPTNQKVAGLIPSQGTGLVVGSALSRGA